LLRDFNVQVDVVGDGLEAVHAASSLPYDVICMDMRMPEMDGLMATRTIRERGGRLGTVPIVALTANAFPEDVAACFAAGMTGFVAKPVSKKSLVVALLAALRQTHPADVTATRPPEQEPEDRALDLGAYARLEDDIGATGLAQVVTMFEAETRDRLSQIAGGGLDPARLIREVHSLNGTAGAACAGLLSARAAALELRLKGGEGMEPAEVAGLSEAFTAWIKAVRAAELRVAQAA
jgi:CheY-like chemotaxis protein/HPt (histidine-containing phosphotransfer) domain-containing protein